MNNFKVDFDLVAIGSKEHLNHPKNPFTESFNHFDFFSLLECIDEHSTYVDGDDERFEHRVTVLYNRGIKVHEFANFMDGYATLATYCISYGLPKTLKILLDNGQPLIYSHIKLLEMSSESNVRFNESRTHVVNLYNYCRTYVEHHITDKNCNLYKRVNQCLELLERVK